MALFWGVIGCAAIPAGAAPEASYVMDARTGETLFESNADTKLHPASLTKMLTLYIAFEEIERGRLSLDSMITVSKNAAAQPPSRLGLKAGQKIQLRYLIRAAAIKSANDAAQAIGDAIGGNQAQFAERMNRTARALGMRNSTFKNANGLTAKGHLSTARDMSILGRHLFYDFPQYYNIFSRRETDAGLADVANTNRKFLDAYKGADGIKTGYTQPAGFNLTASAERGGVRLIATLFGGVSTPDRNAKVAKLLDRGFAVARGGIKAAPPAAPQYENADNELIANAVPDDGLPEGGAGASAKTVRAVLAMTSSPRPMPRPDMSELADDAQEMVAEMAGGIAGALAEANATAAPLPFALATADPAAADTQPALATEVATMRPAPRPTSTPTASPEFNPNVGQIIAAAPASAPPTDTALAADVAQLALADAQPAAMAAIVPNAAPAAPVKPQRQAPIYDDQAILAKASAPPQGAPAPVVKGEVVTRLSTSGGHHWGVNVGRFASSDAAERILIKTQLVESATLGQSLRKVTKKGGGFDANFLGMTQEAAALACRRLTARSIPCIPLGP
ncbi:MAG: D-alanyl-D-alanine carboxypeptidase family protein [Cypionkella sp.]|nr:D-alanyl-D-alanine carboxypeptidase family protein [Cypionkella sp.]